MKKFMILVFFLAISGVMACEPVQDSAQYKPESFLNLTLNNRGYEFDPMPQVKDPYVKHLNSLSIPENKVLRILEIGGAYGKLLRETFARAEYKVIKHIVYDFCELDKGHVDIAKDVFERDFPLRKEQVNYIISDALDFLDKTDFTYDIILICNVVHFLSPTQLLDILQNMKKRLDINGKIYGMAQTPYYNFEKDQVKLFQPGMPCPIVPGEEINRQMFEKLRKMGCLFPGFPGINSPSLNLNTTSPCDYNSLDKVNLSIILEEFGFNYEISEFSYDDRTYYLSGKRWVSFILSKGVDNESPKIMEFYQKAKIEETLNIRIFQQILKANINNIYSSWLDYLKALGVKEASNVMI